MPLRSLFAALFVLPLMFGSASALATHHLALQVSDDSAEKMNAALNVAANVSRYYADKGEEIEIEIVAFNAGITMLRADKSPVLDRLKSFKQGMPNVSFMACAGESANSRRTANRVRSRARIGSLPDIIAARISGP